MTPYIVRHHRRFNPRAREGATQVLESMDFDDIVSIHAPVKARPVASGVATGKVIVSIHAPVKARPRQRGRHGAR